MGYFETRWPALLMRPLSGLYGLAIRRRNRRFDSGAAEVFRLDRPVISVGNIVVGGTGKTPTVLYLVRWLQQQDQRVCILSRGYRRRSRGMVVVADGEGIRSGVEEAGDEPMLLAQQLPGAVVVVDSDRAAPGGMPSNTFDRISFFSTTDFSIAGCTGISISSPSRSRAISATAGCCRRGRCGNGWRP